MAVRHWVDALLTPRRDSEISCSSGGPFPKASGSPLPAATHPLMPRWEDPVPSPRKTDTAVGLAECHMTQPLKWDKRAYMEPEMERHAHTR